MSDYEAVKHGKESALAFIGELQQSLPDKEQEAVSDFMRITEEWPNIVGHSFAKFTSPIEIKGKKLIIFCEHPGAYQRITWMERDIVAKVSCIDIDITGVCVQRVMNDKVLERRANG